MLGTLKKKGNQQPSIFVPINPTLLFISKGIIGTVEGIIYKYTSPSGKSYIGQTMNESRRKKEFFNSFNYAGDKIENARKKYGASNFLYEVLYRTENSDIKLLTEELNQMEIYYIGYYDTVNNGYNTSIGGQSSNGVLLNEEVKQKMIKSLKDYYKNHPNPFKGHKHTEETKEKLRMLRLGKPSAMKGKHFNFSEEERQKKRERVKKQVAGKKNPFYGKKHSDETKRKISEKNSKGVLQIDPKTNEVINEFDSAYHAGCFLGKPRANSEIVKVCRSYRSPSGRHYNTCLGFKWQYKNEGSTTIPKGSTPKRAEMGDSPD